MNNKNLSDVIREALQYLKFDKIPKIKELEPRYRKLALLKHPDKNGGSDAAKEEFQHLQNCKRLIEAFIKEDDSDSDEVIIVDEIITIRDPQERRGDQMERRPRREKAKMVRDQTNINFLFC